jgi:hypothetical protein
LYTDRWQGQVYSSNKRGRNTLVGAFKKTMFAAAVKFKKDLGGHLLVVGQSALKEDLV